MRKQKRNSAGKELTKKQFVAYENETAAQCVARMKAEGYMPVRRTVTPIFRETPDGPVCIGHECRFEGRKILTKDEQ